MREDSCAGFLRAFRFSEGEIGDNPSKIFVLISEWSDPLRHDCVNQAFCRCGPCRPCASFRCRSGRRAVGARPAHEEYGAQGRQRSSCADSGPLGSLHSGPALLCRRQGGLRFLGLHHRHQDADQSDAGASARMGARKLEQVAARGCREAGLRRRLARGDRLLGRQLHLLPLDGTGL